MMETVSTLCATGSILGAAGIGYVFGQVPVHPAAESANYSSAPSHLSRLRPSRYKHENAQSEVGSTVSSNDQTQPAFQEQLLSPLPQLAPITTPVSTHPTQHLDSYLEKAVFTGDQTNTALQISAKQSSDSLTRRPSRLKKFASFTLSTSSSQAASLGYDSKSLALSSESNKPFFKSASQPSHLPPNKLVKRSISQHLVDKPGSGDLGSTKHTIDRPATSHKRLATLSRGSPHLANAESPINTSSHPLHQPLFRPKLSKDKLHSLSKPNIGTNIRRMYPETFNTPVLLLAHSLAPVTVEIDVTLEADRELYTLSSPPSTASSSPYFLSSSGLVQPKSGNIPYHPKPRHSFSIGDLISRTSASREEPPKRLKITKQRRVMSSPAYKMASPKDKQKQSSANTPRKRSIRAEKQDLPSDLESAPRTPARSNNLTRSKKTNLRDSFGPPETKFEQPSDNQESSNSLPSQVSLHRPRRSITPSDNASSQLGSDIDGKVFSSGDEDEGDKRSDSVYDSLRTGATRSSSGFRAPPLETLFDKEPASQGSGYQVNVSSQRYHGNSPTFDEETSNSTPSRTVIAGRRDSGPSVPMTPTIPSSPPSIPKPLNLGDLTWDSDVGEEDNFWFPDEDGESWDHSDDIDQAGPSAVRDANGRLIFKQSPYERSLRFATPKSAGEKVTRKNNLFDWSEPHPVPSRPSENHLSRPRTVHGKNGPVGGSRPSGRRIPSGLHARSKSVPALADLVSNSSQMTSKFGTWGVSSKGATEDWNDDFEFEVSDLDSDSDRAGAGVSSMSARQTMVVPESIKEHHTNVLANIGLLKQWGLHIEELKELRERAISLGLQTEELSDLFHQVDAMIELADQEPEDDELQLQTTLNKSPGLDLEDFGSVSSSPMVRDGSRAGIAEPDHATSSPTASGSRASPATRPRKNSQAVAQFVIEALQNRRRVPPSKSSPAVPSRKVPFDTTTLRHIVPHVSTLSKKFKQAIREAEGLHYSPTEPQRPPDSPLRRAFIDPEDDETSEDEDEDDKGYDTTQLTNDMGSANFNESHE